MITAAVFDLYQNAQRKNVSMHENVATLTLGALKRWGLLHPRKFYTLMRIGYNVRRAQRRQRLHAADINGIIPSVVSISPTMRCNYNCTGCYSRTRPTEDELTTEELDSLFAEAVRLGVCACVVTGGEPFLRHDIVDLMYRYRRLLFVPITNGSRIDRDIARRMAKSGNIVPLVSIEGDRERTDSRRVAQAYAHAMHAFSLFKQAGLPFGFAATNTAQNTDYLGSDEFITTVKTAGCSIGFFSEYVPCGPAPRQDWVLSEAQRDAFRQRVVNLRCNGPLMLVQFPHDEYGTQNKCTAAGTLSLHINSQGDIEPCPFVSIYGESIRNGGLKKACESRFLASIRANPHLLKRRVYACALFEHKKPLEKLAALTKKENRSICH